MWGCIDVPNMSTNKCILSILSLLFFYSNIDAQTITQYETLFDGVIEEAPSILDMNVLKNYPKFRCIHHDAFDRSSAVPVDDKTGGALEYYSIADKKALGKNSYQNKDDLGYINMVTKGASFDVGVRLIGQDYVAMNAISWWRRNKVKIMTVDAKRSEYGLMVKRMDRTDVDAKVAFRVVDAKNYMYAQVSDVGISVYSVQNGKRKMVNNWHVRNACLMYFLLQDDMAYVYADRKYLGCCYIGSDNGSTICGLLFKGNELSAVNDFVVDYPDEWTNNGMDGFIESGSIKKGQFGSWQTEEGLITVSNNHTKDSKYSLRFELNYYPQWEQHKVAGSRRTEICPKAVKSAPLDSWISSFDVYFPCKNDGVEYWQKDDNSEVLWQSHDNGAASGLSPHLALRCQNDVLTITSLARSELRYDKQNIRSQKDYGELNNKIAILVDKLSEKGKGLELKKGEWHNITIYVREGYSMAQLPRTIVYVDGKKVIDWFHPNAYNCGEKAEFLKMGIYKWSWAKDNLDTKVKKRVIYHDNIQYLR